VSFIKLLKQPLLHLVLSIVLAMTIAKGLSLTTVCFFYTVSSCFIEVLLFALPLIVFSFILSALVNIERGSFKLLLLIFAGVTFSNCLALTTSYFFSKAVLPFVGVSLSPDFATKFASVVDVTFKFGFPNVIGTEKALLIGIGCGIFLNFLNETNTLRTTLKDASIWLSVKVSMLLSKIFIPLLPIYVFGFCLKLSYDDALAHLFQQYGKVFFLSLSLVALYISALYLVASHANMRKAISYIKIMLPAGLTGFSTMSSAATMPVTLRCTQATTQDKNFTDLVIPSTANIHMLGDDLVILMMAMALLSIFGMPWPDFTTFTQFAFAFSMAKLSCVGIPGASVFVVLPVLQTYLGFSPEMISVLTTLYVLQDPFGTAANVMGNGAFALMLHSSLKCNTVNIFLKDFIWRKPFQAFSRC
jgi:Na+/H+-dicarboxylate symporter